MGKNVNLRIIIDEVSGLNFLGSVISETTKPCN